MAPIYEVKEYHCSKGHVFKSVTPPKNQRQADDFCDTCTKSRMKEEAETRIYAREADRKRRWVTNLYLYSDYLRLAEEHISMLEQSLNVLIAESLTPKELTHAKLIQTCKDLLMLEGADPVKIKTEYPITIIGKRYIADIVVLDNNEQIHTVVECGNLSDPLKIQLFNTMFNRFIWIPFTLTPNVGALKDYRQKISTVLQECRDMVNMAEQLSFDITHQNAINEMSALALQEIWKEIAELDDIAG